MPSCCLTTPSVFLKSGAFPAKSRTSFSLRILAGKDLRTLMKESIEAATGLPCRTGEYVQGSPVQTEIFRMVTNSSVLIADTSGDSPNVYTEIGAARGAEVPVALL